jgi:hypothetical protein
MKKILFILLLIPTLCFGQLQPGADLQKAIDSNYGGTIYLAVGDFYHYGLFIRGPITIIGAGSRWDGTVLHNLGSGPNVTIDNPAMQTGARLHNLMLTGNGSGVYVNSQGQSVLDRVYILEQLRYGIEFADCDECHSTVFSIIGCRIENNGKDGIYGRTRSASQKNAITIRNTSIERNQDGINLFGNQVWINENVVEGNRGRGLVVPYSTNQTDINTLIKNNYFEQNNGGNVVRSTR